MTDENLGNSDSGSSDSQQQGVPVDNVNQEPQASVSNTISESAPQQEKMLSQNDVNSMIAGAKRKAYDKGLEVGRSNQGQPTQQPIANNTGAGLGESQISSMIESKMAEMAKQQQENLVMQNNRDQANRIVADLTSKMEAAKQNIPDYEEAMSSVNNFNDVPAILASVHTLDNAGEVLHHLAKNPKDIPVLDALARGIPGAATAELKKISDRLKQNENGKKSAYAPEPISQIETNIRDGIGSGTPQSIADFKNIYRG
jgi:hypothetical protein